jgi:hypothetical protein
VHDRVVEGKPVGTPDASAFWRVIAEHHVKTLFTAPAAFRAIKKDDPAGELTSKYDLSGFRYLFLAGERLDPETYRWAGELLGVPVIDHSSGVQHPAEAAHCPVRRPRPRLPLGLPSFQAAETCWSRAGEHGAQAVTSAQAGTRCASPGLSAHGRGVPACMHTPRSISPRMSATGPWILIHRTRLK